MTRILIIPDVHHKVAKADAIVAHEPHDRVIYLGDYQDDWNDTPDNARQTAAWLKAQLANPQSVMLAGNHDLSYAYPNNGFARCAGFHHFKRRAMMDVIDERDLRRPAFYHEQDGILFSHAGLTMRLINQERLPRELPDLIERLDAQVPIARSCLETVRPHWLYDIGWSRGGNRPFGSLTWCDFDLDMVPTPFPQIVGHSPHPKPLFKLREPDGPAMESVAANEMEGHRLIDYWWVLDLDTNLRHYAVINDGVLTVKECSWTGLGSKTLSYTFDVFSQPIA